jgi:hypothetical protein
MAMQRGENRHAGAARRVLRGPATTAILLIAAAGLGACTTSSPTASSDNRYVAFESIDGPPRATFDILVQKLGEAAQRQNVSVISREAPARYRIRSYVSAQVMRGKTTFAWVWDVYDADQQRATRLAGEELGGRAGKDAWMAADEQVLGRIAQSGMTQLAAYLGGGPPSAPPPAGAEPAPDAPTAIAFASPDAR